MTRTSTGRHGVILLVILGMLALFMLVGVSFVVTSTHARSSSLAQLSLEQTGDSPDREISVALLNVVRGSRSPRSVIGPHSILEDIYGEGDAVVGVVRYAASDIPTSYSTLGYVPGNTGVPIYPETSYNIAGVVNQDHIYSLGELVPVIAISLGPDRVPGVPGVDDDKNGQVDDNFDVVHDGLNPGQVPVGSDDYYLGWQPTAGFLATQDKGVQLGMGSDAVIGHYAGRLLTMLDGPLARQSTRIVWSYPVASGNGGPCFWVLVLRPFSPGLPPQASSASNATTLYNVKTALANHRFVINGRPFNGQGFGFNPLNGMQVSTNAGSLQLATNPRLLNLSHYNLDGNSAEQPFPFALLPNPTDRRYRDYLTDRWTYNSTGVVGGSTMNFPTTLWTAANKLQSFRTNPFGVDADEDYDAPDYQNLHMAWRVWNPMQGVPMLHNVSMTASATGASGAAGPGGRWQTRIPSFHRPELVNYWLQYINAGMLSGSSSSVNIPPVGNSWARIPGGESSGGNVLPRLRQRIILRPDPQDNFDPLTQDVNGNGFWDAAEMFQDTNGNGIWDRGEPTQSNPSGTSPAQPSEPDWSGNQYFNAINGPWDVDNDNDGELDSVWIDLGMPINTAADGTQYKPLAAVLCLDMDGRLNINAHGNNSHVQFANYATSAPLTSMKSQPTNTQSEDSVLVGMWQMHSNYISAGIPRAPIYTRVQSVGPFAGGYQNPAYAATYFSTIPPTNTPSLSLGTGLGFSVADVNLGPLLSFPTLSYANFGTGGNMAFRSSLYRNLLQGTVVTGYPAPGVAVTNIQHMGQPLAGRYGEPHLLNYNAPVQTYGLSLYPQAGITFGQQAGPGVTQQPFLAGSMIYKGFVYDSYDDNVPAAGSPMNQGILSAVNFRGNSYQATMPTGWVSTDATQWINAPMAQAGITTQGAYGSPVDPYGVLMVGLDFRGQPVYANLPNARANTLIDDPWEMDLSPKGKRSSYSLQSTTNPPQKWTFASDAPFTPGELETLLRYGDSDVATLESRPVQLLGLSTQDAQITMNLRNRVTTESWDLPCPNIHPTPEILRGLQMLGLPTTNCSFADLVRGKIAFVQGLNILNNPPGTSNPGALALANEQALLLLAGRVVQVGFNSATGTATPIHARVLPAFSSDLLMGLRMDLNRTFGNSWDDNGNGAIDDPSELTNLFGTGNTLLNADKFYRTFLNGLPNQNTGYAADPNNDGAAWYYSYPTTAPFSTTQATAGTTIQSALPAFDMNARAEMAKNLYMLMMLLTDSDWMYWYPTTQQYLPANTQPGQPVLGIYAPQTSGGTPAPNISASTQPVGFANVINNPPVGFPTYGAGSVPLAGANGLRVMTARQKLAAYKIAQWAVNAVDFADRDAIMTGFEFDLAPFNIDGYSVDGNLASCYSYWSSLPSSPQPTLPSYATYYEPDRAVVWGMEYPDLLITETTAFHDKAWADSTMEKASGKKTTDPMTTDTTWDQARLPQGSLFVELYCPGKPNSASWPTLANGGSYPANPSVGNNNAPYLPTELYDIVTPAPNFSVGIGGSQTGALTPPSRNNRTGNYANVGTLDLERMTPAIPNTLQYPVWRLALARGTVQPRPKVGAVSVSNPTFLNPNAPPPPSAAWYAPPATIGPQPSQSVQNRFMTRPDTTTVMPLTSLSEHSTSTLSQRYSALKGVLPTASVNMTLAQLDSCVVTDFIDTLTSNLPAHAVYLQRYVYFCRPQLNAPYAPNTPTTRGSAYPTLAYPPYSPAYGSQYTTAVSMPQTGATAQTIYQFRPRGTTAGSNSSTNAQQRLLLHPGSYAVVGPRRSSHSPAAVQGGTFEDVTFIGFTDNTSISATGATGSKWHPQAIDLGTDIRPYHLLNPVMMLTPSNGRKNNDPINNAGYPDSVSWMTTKIKNPLCIPCASGAPWPVTTANQTTQWDRGLNISEPPQGYNLTAAGTPSNTNSYTAGNASGAANAITGVQVKDTWVPAAGGGSTFLPDVPFDIATTAGLTGGQSYEPWSAGTPLPQGGSGTMSRTLLDYSTVFLQRLADPTLPWNPTTNPYLTIDWMPIDLTVFNGQNVFQGLKQSMTDTSPVGSGSPTSGGPTQVADFAFETRQRGPRNMTQSSSAQAVLANYPGNPPPTGTTNVPVLKGPGPTGLQTSPYGDLYGCYRWPVTNWETAPFRFVVPNGKSNYGAYQGSLPAVWPSPAQFNTNYTSPYSGYNNEYQAISEAPLWCQMSDDPRQTPIQAQAPTPAMGTGVTANVGFTSYLYGTLGFLNEGYGIVDFNHNATVYGSPSAIDSPHNLNPTNNFLYKLSLSNYYTNTSAVQPYPLSTYANVHGASPTTFYDYIGDPQRPFPWLTWNNRPYASAMELMLVPASQPARFGWEFTYKTAYTDNLAMHPDPYSVPLGVAGQASTPPVIPGGVLWDSHYAWRPNPPWGGLRTNYFTMGTYSNPSVPVTGAQWYPPAPATNIYTSSSGSVGAYSFTGWPGSQLLQYGIGQTLTPLSAFTAGGYPFGHLLNFFGSNGPQACTTINSYPFTAISAGNSPIDPLVGAVGTDPNFGSGTSGNGSLPAVQPASNFHRIFEYVHVPSRFSGTQELLDPVAFAAGSGNIPGNGSATVGHSGNPNSSMSHFLVPFNRVSRYREPGKINLNTISDTWLKANYFAAANSTVPSPYYFMHQPDIFQGMMNDFPGYKYIWDNLLGGLQIQDPRGADKAWGFARNYMYPSGSQPSPTGDDDAQVETPYNFCQSDDHWEAGWPGWQQLTPSGTPTLFSNSKASDDWIPVSYTQPNGQQTLVAGASNERLLNHLAWNPNAGFNFTGPASAINADLPSGSGGYYIPPNPLMGAPGNLGMPTFFPNPFRSFCTSYGVPVPQMLYWWPAVQAIGGTGSGNGGQPLNGYSAGLTTYPMPFYWADSSLLRRARVHPTRRYEPLLVYNSYNWWSPGATPSQSNGVGNAWETPYLAQQANRNTADFGNIFTSYMYPDPVSRAAPHLVSGIYKPSEWGEAFRDSNRNPFFRYQPLLKLGNMTTTRSNVYAIWVTIGYFEVQRAKLDPRNPQSTFDRNPDGYRLVRELGSDKGTVKRHRGFAIFDRTLPVGFLRGENLNVNDAFLVKRTIE